MALDAYIHGHAAAAVMWCRSALETRLKVALVARGIHLPGSQFERVRMAVGYTVIDPALERSARAVFHRGDTTIYKDPTVVRDILGTVKNTMIPLSDLQRRRVE